MAFFAFKWKRDPGYVFPLYLKIWKLFFQISVNEASAQLCWHRPGLLTRREELFPLARDVVRASGYQYAKGHSRLVPTLELFFSLVQLL